jgi:hypothetical protein
MGMDMKGYTRLFPDALIQHVQRKGVTSYGEKRMGCDIAEGGGDSNAFVLRTANTAKVVSKFTSPDTMQTTGMVIQKAKEEDVYDHNWFIDRLGVGKGLVDRLKEQQYRPFEVAFSEKAEDDQQFANQRAECYWRAFKWLNEGGVLEPHADWEQLANIKYRVQDSSGKILIISKDEMRKEGLPSPDVVDAFVSTFARKSIVNKSREEKRRELDLLSQFDFHKQRYAQFRGKRIDRSHGMIRAK